MWWNDNSPITIASHAVGKGREKRRENESAMHLIRLKANHETSVSTERKMPKMLIFTT